MTNIQFDLPFILTTLVIVSGLIVLVDVVFLAKKRHLRKPPIIIEYARSFFPMLLLVLIIRSFLVQPYRVPTGSLEPTILPSEFIVVNQFAYGLRLPVLNRKFLNIGEPKLGDIALFRYPQNPAVLYVKRVIGLPGDHIVYKDKTLTINGKLMPQTLYGIDLDAEEHGNSSLVKVFTEKLDNITHKIFIKEGYRELEHIDCIVPDGQYFMMGDNRDSSCDSRVWGFVPEENLVGRAFGIWFSWDKAKFMPRWKRIGIRII